MTSENMLISTEVCLFHLALHCGQLYTRLSCTQSGSSLRAEPVQISVASRSLDTCLAQGMHSVVVCELDKPKSLPASGSKNVAAGK